MVSFFLYGTFKLTSIERLQEVTCQIKLGELAHP